VLTLHNCNLRDTLMENVKQVFTTNNCNNILSHQYTMTEKINISIIVFCMLLTYKIGTRRLVTGNFNITLSLDCAFNNTL
jgi:hypothetical protein